MPQTSYPVVIATLPTDQGLKNANRRNSENSLNAVAGRLNSVGDLTLTAGTSTTLNSPYIHNGSMIVLMAKSAAAAAIHPSVWITPALKTATITHSTAAGGEAFRWAAFG